MNKITNTITADWRRRRGLAKNKNLKTTAEVFEALGGIPGICALFDLDRRNVWNWKARGFPPESYRVCMMALKALGCNAPPSLWKQYDISKTYKGLKDHWQ
jgi:hypothetical protein